MGYKKITKPITIIIIVLGLFGCVTTTPKTEIVYVDRIIQVEIPEPPTIDRPELRIFTLTSEEKLEPGTVEQAYKITIKQLQGYASQLEAIINGYKKKPSIAPINPN